MRRDRRGVTLVEMLVVIVVLTAVSLTVGRVLLNTLRVSRSQLVQADLQSNVRTGSLVLPMELREIGYDSNITTSVVTSDVELIGTDWIQFRAMRGIGYVCAFSAPALDRVWIRRPVQGFRTPTLNDGFLLYVENDPNIAIDDQWIEMTVFNLNTNANCGGDPAIRLDLAAVPLAGPLKPVTLANVFVGAPVRFFERMRFGSFVDADGRTYLGARSISQGEAAYRAVIGPLEPGNPLELLYFRRNGTPLDPGVGNPVDVRSIDFRLRGLTRNQVNLAGSSALNPGQMRVRTRVALRNTLKH